MTPLDGQNMENACTQYTLIEEVKHCHDVWNVSGSSDFRSHWLSEIRHAVLLFGNALALLHHGWPLQPHPALFNTTQQTHRQTYVKNRPTSTSPTFESRHLPIFLLHRAVWLSWSAEWANTFSCQTPSVFLQTEGEPNCPLVYPHRGSSTVQPLMSGRSPRVHFGL